MKPLLPTLKEKKRYLVYVIETEKHEELPKNIHHKIIHCVEQRIGLFMSAKAGLMHINYEQKTQRGIIKTSVQSTHWVRAALMLITQIEHIPLRITVIGTSGILKKTERFSQQNVGLGGV